MASPKKSKKSKKDRKLKKNFEAKTSRTSDFDWWDSFFNLRRGEYTDTETHSRALLVVIDTAIHLRRVDKFDFGVCMSAYIGVAISVIRVLLFVARPRTFVQGNLPNSMVYRNVEQYPNASNVPGILILEIDAPIYFANANY
ncbi:unnamed protein product [Prunus armeniaca]